MRYKHCVDSDIKVGISKALSQYQKITFRMETRYSRTLVLLPRLITDWENCTSYWG